MHPMRSGQRVLAIRTWSFPSVNKEAGPGAEVAGQGHHPVGTELEMHPDPGSCQHPVFPAAFPPPITLLEPRRDLR